MSAPRFQPIPSGNHALLLRAALLTGEPARCAWQAWREASDLEQLDQVSYRLVPLLVTNLERLGVEDACLSRLRGIRRRLWLETQLALRQMADVLPQLADAGIEVVVLKGAALIEQAYAGAQLRSMADIDILVRWRDIARCMEVLSQAGWKARPGPEQRAFERCRSQFRLRCGGISTMKDGLGAGRFSLIDVHANILSVSRHHAVPFPADRLFAASERFELQGVPVRRLAPHHQLLHLCFHGLQALEMPSIRWVADVHHLLINAGERVDWETLGDELEQHQVVEPVREALAHLVDVYATPVPASFLERLTRMRPTRLERVERVLRLGSPGAREDYLSAEARIRRALGSDLPLGARLRAVLGQVNRLVFRLPYKHWIRPLWGG